jgi:hypothetical protein
LGKGVELFEIREAIIPFVVSPTTNPIIIITRMTNPAIMNIKINEAVVDSVAEAEAVVEAVVEDVAIIKAKIEVQVKIDIMTTISQIRIINESDLHSAISATPKVTHYGIALS